MLSDSLVDSSGSLNYTIIQVMLSVPVPSDMVISPLAMPWFIKSSIINDVSPFTFFFKLSFFDVFVGDVIDDCFVDERPDFFPSFEGDPIVPFFGPFSLF